jgi:hypothetical protein
MKPKRIQVRQLRLSSAVPSVGQQQGLEQHELDVVPSVVPAALTSMMLQTLPSPDAEPVGPVQSLGVTLAMSLMTSSALAHASDSDANLGVTFLMNKSKSSGLNR